MYRTCRRLYPCVLQAVTELETDGFADGAVLAPLRAQLKASYASAPGEFVDEVCLVWGGAGLHWVVQGCSPCVSTHRHRRSSWTRFAFFRPTSYIY